MGEIKRLAARLAVCVYRYHMSNEEIIEAVKSLSSDKTSEVDCAWLSEQISLIRKYPIFTECFRVDEH